MSIPIILNNVVNLQDTTTAQTTINNNNTAITTAFGSAVNVSGSQMTGNLDMNSNQIINLPAPNTANSPVRLQDVVLGTSVIAGTIVTTTGTQTLTNKSISGSQINSGTVAVANGGTGVSTVAGIQALIQSFQMVFYATGVNFNTIGDTAIAISLPTGFSRYEVASVRIFGASASLTTSTVGLFTGAGGTGTSVVNTGTAVLVSTSADGTVNNAQVVATNNTNSASYTVAGFPTLYFRVTNPEGSAATANIAIVILILP